MGIALGIGLWQGRCSSQKKQFLTTRVNEYHLEQVKRELQTFLLGPV